MESVARVRCVYACVRTTRPLTANALRGKIPVSNRTKLASRRVPGAGIPPPPSMDQEQYSPFGKNKKSTEADGMFFLGMAVFMTLLFTREWIGDVVPVIVFLIAVLAFTPLGDSLGRALDGRSRGPGTQYAPRKDWTTLYEEGAPKQSEVWQDEGAVQGYRDVRKYQEVAPGQRAARRHQDVASCQRDLGQQGRETESVEAVEVLTPKDYEHLQRQQRRMERRAGMGTAQHSSHLDYSVSHSAGNTTDDADLSSSWWNSADETARYANVKARSSRQTWQSEQERNTKVRSRAAYSDASMGSRQTVAAQSWGSDASDLQASSRTTRRMTARDLAAGKQRGYMSRVNSRVGVGMNPAGPVGGIVRWMFGARARARVGDTVRAARRPLLSAIVQVFPFLRSWGGFL